MSSTGSTYWRILMFSTRLLAVAVLAVVLALSSAQNAFAVVVVSCPFSTPGHGDFIYRGFYVSPYPSSNLPTVHVRYDVLQVEVGGSYAISMTARLGTFDGPVIGSTQTVVVTLSSTSWTDAWFNFGDAPVPSGSTVTFTQVKVSGLGDVYYDVGNGNPTGNPPNPEANCPGVFETEYTNPPLDSIRRYTVGLEIGEFTVTTTVTTSPSGLTNSIVVDTVTYTSPQTFTWDVGSSHTIEAVSTVSGALGILYVWTSWSDGGARSHSVTAPSTPTTYTANYQTQYLVDYVASGCALWVSVPFEWVNSGAGAAGTFPSSVTDAGTRCSFVSDNRPTVPPGVTAPTTVTGTYQTQYYLTVNSPYDTPRGQGWYDSGAPAHATLDTGVVSGNPGVQYVFTGWGGDASGAGLISDMITMDAPKTAVANWRADVTSFNGQAVSFSTSGGALQDMTPMSDSIVPQTGRPPGLIMPYGLFSFQINVPTAGASVTVTITFASTLPAGMQWWKVHGGVWVQLPPSQVSQSGNTLTITLTDGATPDDFDGLANGMIVDPGGAGTIDVTPPVITPSVSGTLGSNGWYTSDVTVTWSVSDPESGIASSSGCGSTTINSDTTGTTLTCSATNGAGLSNSVSVTIKRDATPPSVTITPSRSADPNGWYNHALDFTVTGSDATSLVASCTSISTYSGPDSASASVSASCTDNAGNTGSATFNFKYDATPPTISITVPVNGETYGLNQPVTASYSCDDSLSLVDTCAGTVPIGTLIDTSSPGSKTFSVTATDKAGNPTTRTITYSVTILAGKQSVLHDLIALRATVTDKEDGKRLDKAIDHLTKSLDTDLWVDGSHLNAKHGDKVFNEEKDAVVKLLELLNDKKSTLGGAQRVMLQSFVDRLVGADKALAKVAIDDAQAAHGDLKKINKANEELSKGDGKIASGDFTPAIEHYRNAWNQAQQAVKK